MSRVLLAFLLLVACNVALAAGTVINASCHVLSENQVRSGTTISLNFAPHLVVRPLTESTRLLWVNSFIALERCRRGDVLQNGFRRRRDFLLDASSFERPSDHQLVVNIAADPDFDIPCSESVNISIAPDTVDSMTTTVMLEIKIEVHHGALTPKVWELGESRVRSGTSFAIELERGETWRAFCGFRLHSSTPLAFWGRVVSPRTLIIVLNATESYDISQRVDVFASVGGCGTSSGLNVTGASGTKIAVITPESGTFSLYSPQGAHAPALSEAHFLDPTRTNWSFVDISLSAGETWSSASGVSNMLTASGTEPDMLAAVLHHSGPRVLNASTLRLQFRSNSSFDISRSLHVALGDLSSFVLSGLRPNLRVGAFADHFWLLPSPGGLASPSAVVTEAQLAAGVTVLVQLRDGETFVGTARSMLDRAASNSSFPQGWAALRAYANVHFAHRGRSMAVIFSPLPFVEVNGTELVQLTATKSDVASGMPPMPSDFQLHIAPSPSAFRVTSSLAAPYSVSEAVLFDGAGVMFTLTWDWYERWAFGIEVNITACFAVTSAATAPDPNGLSNRVLVTARVSVNTNRTQLRVQIPRDAVLDISKRDVVTFMVLPTAIASGLQPLGRRSFDIRTSASAAEIVMFPHNISAMDMISGAKVSFVLTGVKETFSEGHGWFWQQAFQATEATSAEPRGWAATVSPTGTTSTIGCGGQCVNVSFEPVPQFRLRSASEKVTVDLASAPSTLTASGVAPTSAALSLIVKRAQAVLLCDTQRVSERSLQAGPVSLVFRLLHAGWAANAASQFWASATSNCSGSKCTIASSVGNTAVKLAAGLAVSVATVTIGPLGALDLVAPELVTVALPASVTDSPVPPTSCHFTVSPSPARVIAGKRVVVPLRALIGAGASFRVVLSEYETWSTTANCTSLVHALSTESPALQASITTARCNLVASGSKLDVWLLIPTPVSLTAPVNLTWPVASAFVASGSAPEDSVVLEVHPETAPVCLAWQTTVSEVEIHRGFVLRVTSSESFYDEASAEAQGACDASFTHRFSSLLPGTHVVTRSRWAPPQGEMTVVLTNTAEVQRNRTVNVTMPAVCFRFRPVDCIITLTIVPSPAAVTAVSATDEAKLVSVGERDMLEGELRLLLSDYETWAPPASGVVGRLRLSTGQGTLKIAAILNASFVRVFLVPDEVDISSRANGKLLVDASAVASKRAPGPLEIEVVPGVPQCSVDQPMVVTVSQLRGSSGRRSWSWDIMISSTGRLGRVAGAAQVSVNGIALRNNATKRGPRHLRVEVIAQQVSEKHIGQLLFTIPASWLHSGIGTGCTNLTLGSITSDSPAQLVAWDEHGHLYPRQLSRRELSGGIVLWMRLAGPKSLSPFNDTFVPADAALQFSGPVSVSWTVIELRPAFIRGVIQLPSYVRVASHTNIWISISAKGVASGVAPTNAILPIAVSKPWDLTVFGQNRSDLSPSVSDAHIAVGGIRILTARVAGGWFLREHHLNFLEGCRASPSVGLSLDMSVVFSVSVLGNEFNLSVSKPQPLFDLPPGIDRVTVHCPLAAPFLEPAAVDDGITFTIRQQPPVFHLSPTSLSASRLQKGTEALVLGLAPGEIWVNDTSAWSRWVTGSFDAIGLVIVSRIVHDPHRVTVTFGPSQVKIGTSTAVTLCPPRDLVKSMQAVLCGGPVPVIADRNAVPTDRIALRMVDAWNGTAAGVVTIVDDVWRLSVQDTLRFSGPFLDELRPNVTLVTPTHVRVSFHQLLALATSPFDVIMEVPASATGHGVVPQNTPVRFTFHLPETVSNGSLTSFHLMSGAEIVVRANHIDFQRSAALAPKLVVPTPTPIAGRFGTALSLRSLRADGVSVSYVAFDTASQVTVHLTRTPSIVICRPIALEIVFPPRAFAKHSHANVSAVVTVSPDENSLRFAASVPFPPSAANATSFRATAVVLKVNGDDLREFGLIALIGSLLGGLRIEGAAQRPSFHASDSNSHECPSCFRNTVAAQSWLRSAPDGSSLVLSSPPVISFDARGNETISLRHDALSGFAACTLSGTLSLSIVDPEPSVTSAHLEVSSVHPQQPTTLTLTGHGFRLGETPWRDQLSVVDRDARCGQRSMPLTVLSSRAQQSRHSLSSPGGSITFTVPATGRFRVCWRFNRTGTAVDLSRTGAGILISRASVEVWERQLAVVAGATIELVFAGEGLFPFIGEDMVVVSAMRHRSHLRNCSGDARSSQRVGFSGAGSQPVSQVRLRTAFNVSGLLTVCYMPSRGVPGESVFVGLLSVSPKFSRVIPDAIEPFSSVMLLLEGVGLDGRDPDGSNFTRGIRIGVGDAEAPDHCAGSMVQALSNRPITNAVPVATLDIGSTPQLSPGRYAICVSAFPAHTWQPSLLSLLVMARPSSMTVQRESVVTPATANVSITWSGANIGDAAIQFRSFAVAAASSSICDEIDAESPLVRLPIAAYVHTSDTVISTFALAESGVFAVCWTTNERRALLPFRPLVHEDHDKLFVSALVTDLAPANASTFDVGDSVMVTLEGLGLQGRTNGSVSFGTCGQEEDGTPLQLVSQTVFTMASMTFEAAGLYSICVFTPHVGVQTVGQYAVGATVDPVDSVFTAEQFDVLEIQLSGKGLDSSGQFLLLTDADALDGGTGCTTAALDQGSTLVSIAFETANAGNVSLPTALSGNFHLCHWQPLVGRMRFVASVAVAAIRPRVLDSQLLLSASGSELSITFRGRGLSPGNDRVYIATDETCAEPVAGVGTVTTEAAASSGQVSQISEAVVRSDLFRQAAVAVNGYVCYSLTLIQEAVPVRPLELPIANQPPVFALRQRRWTAFSHVQPTVVTLDDIFSTFSTGPRNADGNETVRFDLQLVDPQNVVETPDLHLTRAGVLQVAIRGRASGAVNITIVAIDSGGDANGGQPTSQPHHLLLDVHFRLNTPPDVAIPQSVNVSVAAVRDAGGQLAVPGVLANISADSGGATGLPAQTVTLQVATMSNGSTAWPTAGVSALSFLVDGTMLITLTSAPVDYTIDVQLWVRAVDDGPSKGLDGPFSTPWYPFIVRLVAWNHPPSYGLHSTAPIVLRGSETRQVDIVSDLSAGLYGENQSVWMSIQVEPASDLVLFAEHPSIGTDGALRIQARPGAQIATISLVLRAHDSGGTAGGGSSTSDARTLTVWLAVPYQLTPDTPSLTSGRPLRVSVDGGHPDLTAMGLTMRVFISLDGVISASHAIQVGETNATMMSIALVPPGSSHVWASVTERNGHSEVVVASVNVDAKTSDSWENFSLPDPAVNLQEARFAVLALSQSFGGLRNEQLDLARLTVLAAVQAIRFQEQLRPETRFLDEQGLRFILANIDGSFAKVEALSRRSTSADSGRANEDSLRDAVSILRAAIRDANWAIAGAFNASVVDSIARSIGSLVSHAAADAVPWTIWASPDERAGAFSTVATRRQRASLVSHTAYLLHDAALLACVSSRVAAPTLVVPGLWWLLTKASLSEVSSRFGLVSAVANSSCTSLAVVEEPQLLPASGDPRDSPRGVSASAVGVNINGTSIPALVPSDRCRVPLVESSPLDRLQGVTLQDGGYWSVSMASVAIDGNQVGLDASTRGFGSVAKWTPVEKGETLFAVFVTCALLIGLAAGVGLAMVTERSKADGDAAETASAYVVSASQGLPRATRVARTALVTAPFFTTIKYSAWSRPVRAALCWSALVNGAFVASVYFGREVAVAQFEVDAELTTTEYLLHSLLLALGSYGVTMLLYMAVSVSCVVFRAIFLGRWVPAPLSISGEGQTGCAFANVWRIALIVSWQTVAITVVALLASTYESARRQSSFVWLALAITVIQLTLLDALRLALTELLRAKLPQQSPEETSRKKAVLDAIPVLDVDLPEGPQRSWSAQSSVADTDISGPSPSAPDLPHRETALRRSRSFSPEVWSPAPYRGSGHHRAASGRSELPHQDPFERLADGYAFGKDDTRDDQPVFLL